MTPLAVPRRYPSFTLVTLKTTGRDGNCIKTRGFHSGAARLALFPGQSQGTNPYVRQYNALWSITPPVVADREDGECTHAQIHWSDLGTGLSGWLLWQLKWHGVCVHQNVSGCVCRSPSFMCMKSLSVRMCMHSLSLEMWTFTVCVFVFLIVSWLLTQKHKHTYCSARAVAHFLSLVQMACWTFLFYFVLIVPQFRVSRLAQAICPD